MRSGSTIRPARRLRRRGSSPPGRRRFPHRPSDRPSGRSIRSPVAALGAPAGSRLAPPPGRCRSSQESLHDLRSVPRAPPPPGPKGLPTSESFCVRHDRRPTRPPAGCYALHGPTKPSAPTRHAVAAPTRVATAMRPSCPVGGMLEGGQPIRLGAQRNHRPTRPHRYSHFPSDLKVRPPAGGQRLIRPAHEAARAVCMYDVAGAASRPRNRRALRKAPGGQRSAKLMNGLQFV